MKDRNSVIVSLFIDGKTLQEIGDIYGISRERVRQILSNCGLTRADGGRAVKAKRRKEEKARKREEEVQRRYGCSIEFYDSMRGDESYHESRVRRFAQQRNNAKKRGIDWNLTFYDWCNIWGDKWESRGRTLGQFVMARNGDTGPYSADNVKIVTCSENILEYYSSLDDPFEHGEKIKEGQKKWER
jgi:hypothetical protein